MIRRNAESNSLLFLIFLVLVAWLPVPVGSNRPWAWELMHAGTMALAGLWLLDHAFRHRRLPDMVFRQRTCIAWLALWMIFIAAQSFPFPAGVVEILNPVAFDLQSKAAGVGVNPRYGISVDRGSSLYELQKLSAYAVLFVFTLALVTTRKRLRAILTCLVLVGAAQALYGIVASLGAEQFGLWHPGKNQSVVSGTYVNPNHFAGLMEITSAAAIGLILSESSDIGSGRLSWREHLRWVVDNLLRRTGWLSFSLLLMMTALVLSTSRGGLAAVLLGLGLATLLSLVFHGRDAAESRMLPRVALFSLVGIAWLGAGGLLDKLDYVGLSSNRSDLRAATFEIIKDYPLTGSGAGTFRWVFPAYKGETFGDGYYEYAHNDYLQLLAEQGVVGFSLAAIFILLIFSKIVVSYVRLHDPLVRGAQFAAIAGAASMLAHGLVDFNFNIPANAAMFSVLLGIGLAAAGVPRHRDKSARTAVKADPAIR